MRILLLVLCLTVLRGQLGAAAVNSMISCNNNCKEINKVLLLVIYVCMVFSLLQLQLES